MEDDGVVTRWIEQLRTGDREAAARALWERYFEKLVAFARRRMKGSPRRMADEEDVALSVFHSFCDALSKGRFPDLRDRDDLWRLLLWIAARKVIDRRRHDGRAKRMGLRESGLDGMGSEASENDLDRLIADTPAPDFLAIAAEECQRLLDLLGDQQLREVAVSRMAGLENREIARRHECSLRTIERQLGLIRRKWKEVEVR